jgi:hypothetical protein
MFLFRDVDPDTVIDYRTESSKVRMSVVLSKNLTTSPVYQRTIPSARSRKELRNQLTTNAEALSPQERPCGMASILDRDLHPRPTIGISLFGEDCRRHPTKSSQRVGFTRTNASTGSPPVIICVLCSCQTRSESTRSCRCARIQKVLSATHDS